MSECVSVSVCVSVCVCVWGECVAAYIFQSCSSFSCSFFFHTVLPSFIYLWPYLHLHFFFLLRLRLLRLLPSRVSSQQAVELSLFPSKVCFPRQQPKRRYRISFKSCPLYRPSRPSHRPPTPPTFSSADGFLLATKKRSGSVQFDGQ